MALFALGVSAARMTMSNILLSRMSAPAMNVQFQQERGASRSWRKTKRRVTHPFKWWARRTADRQDKFLSASNIKFLNEQIKETRVNEEAKSPLSDEVKALIAQKKEWTPESVRCGLICKKIGIIPYWKKNGQRGLMTLLQVPDNHVITSYTSEEFQKSAIYQRRWHAKGFAAMVVGADTKDPRTCPSEYLGLFTKAGVLPKRRLTSMLCTDDALLPVGTQLTIDHFRVGDYVDVFGKSQDRGFEGVMTRWKFRGLPDRATTKAHRRPGSLACGRRMAGPLRGKKLPGHMGSERRHVIGIKILRMDHRYNVLFLRGPSVPGGVGSYCYVYDSRTEKKLHTSDNPPPFPTYFPPEEGLDISSIDVVYDKTVHKWTDPTIVYAQDPEADKKTIRTGAKLAKVRAKK